MTSPANQKHLLPVFELKHVAVGTSGHIDHGKSTLVKALTGTDPDRFEEEKSRGITIDLGFAHYGWNDEVEVSFIDVPGHERFVHNMLAGAGGIQLLILVVAADGGVMPQTKEHLHICDLLGIQRGITVITRCDLADEEMIELVEEEVRELVESTFLHNGPILKTSSVEGTGISELKEEIARQIEFLDIKSNEGYFRLPVDRRFTLKGFGTIVTGTVLSGRASLKDKLVLYPRSSSIKIRGFQTHQKEVDSIGIGQRSAINIAGIHKDDILRGDQIATPGRLTTTKIIDVELRVIPEKTGILKNRFKIRFFSNAQEVTGRIFTFANFDSNISDVQFVQIRLEKPICCHYNDRFIIRNPSPMETIAGGRIIAPLGNRSRRNRERLIESLSGLASGYDEVRILETVFLSGVNGITIDQLPPLVNCTQKMIQRSMQKLSSTGEIVCIDTEKKRYLHQYHCQRISRFFSRALALFHQKCPEKRGAPGTDFLGKMKRMYNLPEILALLNWAVKQGTLEKKEGHFRLPGFQGGLDKQQKILKEKILSLLQKNRVSPPGVINMSEALGVDKKILEKILKIGLSEKWIVKVKDDLWYLPEAVDEVKKILLDFFSERDRITVLDFKELLGISRKHAIGLLEYFDGRHLTRRVGNHRILRLEHSGSR